MVWGQVASAVIGGYMANKAAKKQAGAMDRANEMSNMGYLDSRPYITDLYSRGQNALNNQLAAGYYQGPTYAGLNDMQTTGLGNQYDFGQAGFDYGRNIAQTSSGFSGNYADLYNRANNSTAMSDAINYATNNSQPLIDAAMRGANRQLNEVSLQNLNNAASSSGNTRSSRAGTAEAILRRGVAEQEADVTANINDQLMNRSLNQSNTDFANAMNANAGLAAGFGTGMNTGFTSANNMINAGGAFQKDLQNQYNDDRQFFEGNRDYEMNVLGNYGNAILGRAPTEGKNYQANLVDPTMAALGGAQMGFGMYNKFFPNGFNFGGGGGGSPAYQPSQGYSMTQSPAAGMGGSNPYIF